MYFNTEGGQTQREGIHMGKKIAAAQRGNGQQLRLYTRSPSLHGVQRRTWCILINLFQVCFDDFRNGFDAFHDLVVRHAGIVHAEAVFMTAVGEEGAAGNVGNFLFQTL